jgi:hypothetical protein
MSDNENKTKRSLYMFVIGSLFVIILGIFLIWIRS